MQNLLNLALYSFSSNQFVNIIVWVALVCLLLWGVRALIMSTGIAIPQPVKIVVYVLGGILLILLAVKLFEALL